MAESKFPSRWRVLSWSCVLASVGLSIWWHFHLPTVGKGGLILALAAVLMPLFWENVAVPEKMSWIAMLCILMSVEYRAIDKEHYDNANAQQKALEAIGNGFTGVLNDQRNSFADLIKKSDEAFKKTAEQASAQFDATMRDWLLQIRSRHSWGNIRFTMCTFQRFVSHGFQILIMERSLLGSLAAHDKCSP